MNGSKQKNRDKKQKKFSCISKRITTGYGAFFSFGGFAFSSSAIFPRIFFLMGLLGRFFMSPLFMAWSNTYDIFFFFLRSSISYLSLFSKFYTYILCFGLWLKSFFFVFGRPYVYLLHDHFSFFPFLFFSFLFPFFFFSSGCGGAGGFLVHLLLFILYGINIKFFHSISPYILYLYAPMLITLAYILLSLSLILSFSLCASTSGSQSFGGGAAPDSNPAE